MYKMKFLWQFRMFGVSSSKFCPKLSPHQSLAKPEVSQTFSGQKSASEVRAECEQSASESASRVRASASRVRAECEQSASERERVRVSVRSKRERVPSTLLGFMRKILLEVLLELSAALPQKIKNGRNELTTKKWPLSFPNSLFSDEFWALCRESAGNFFFRPPTRFSPQAAGICKVEFVLLREQILRKSTWLHAIPVHLGHPEPAKTDKLFVVAIIIIIKISSKVKQCYCCHGHSWRRYELKQFIEKNNLFSAKVISCLRIGEGDHNPKI